MIFEKFKKQKSEYYCFYDSEFNAYDNSKTLEIPQEVVSIGICITNDKGVIIEKYYSLIRLKVAKKITNRCTEITGIKTRDLKDADHFEIVTKKIYDLLKKYNIRTVYCYGSEDKRMLEKTTELYTQKNKGKYLSKMLRDVREDFKKKTKGKVGDQGLQFLKSICHIAGDVEHDALQDAIDLANVYYHLWTQGYDKKIFVELSKEREFLSSYKRNKRIKEENSIVVPDEIVMHKNKLVDFLEKNEIAFMDDGAKKAFIDDLNLLFVSE